MDDKSRTDPRTQAWVALVALCCILFWNLGYHGAKLANGLPVDFGIMEALTFGCIAYLAGFVLRRRQNLR